MSMSSRALSLLRSTQDDRERISNNGCCWPDSGSATTKMITFSTQVQRVLLEVEKMLVSKNEAYGNSALDPVRIFSSADPSEQIRVRIDDKLSRLARGSDAGEDVIKDLMGYLVLLRIAESPEESNDHG